MTNETVFITGFPGFLATRLIRRLARCGAQFILLTQASFFAQARETADQIAQECSLSPQRFRVIEGDVTEPDLGLSPAELEYARRQTTTIFHLAAIYDLAVASDVAAHVNVEGTLNINRFARTVANLGRYHYVSTCYVAGKREGVILESELHHDKGIR